MLIFFTPKPEIQQERYSEGKVNLCFGILDNIKKIPAYTHQGSERHEARVEKPKGN